MATSTVHLIDASPFLFRAWFSLPEMEAPSGRPVSAVRGFADFLLRYLPCKAQRDLPREELEDQLQGCQRVARALGVASFPDERYEADDLMRGKRFKLTVAAY